MTVAALIAAAGTASAAGAAPEAAAEPPDGSLGWRLLIMAAALLASFLFSAVEFAVIRLDRLKLDTEAAADPPDPAAKLLSGFLGDSGRFLACISIGSYDVIYLADDGK